MGVYFILLAHLYSEAKFAFEIHDIYIYTWWNLHFKQQIHIPKLFQTNLTFFL